MFKRNILLFICWILYLHASAQSENAAGRDTTRRLLKPVGVKVSVLDSSSGKNLLSSMSADSAGIPLTTIQNPDTGVFQLALFPGGTYQLHVTADQYQHFDTAFLAGNTADSFSVTLRKSGIIPSHASAAPERPAATPVWMTVALVIIGLLTVLSLIFNVVTFKKIQSLSNMQTVQNSNETDENAEHPDGGQTEIPSQPMDVQPAVSVIAPVANEPVVRSSKPATFLCEIMMTAGPRKKFMSEENADKDLGEDVCGFITSSDKVWMWLLDGTSDLHCLKNPVDGKEYFSSRLLAVSIAESLRKQLIALADDNLTGIVNNAIQEVKSNWLSTIDELPAEEKQLLKKSIENKNYPECAITLLTARLSDKGEFLAYRSGDSKMYVFGETADGLQFISTPLAEKNDESNDRVFFRLWVNDQGNFDIISNDPLHEIVTKTGVSTVISFSDGIGSETEHALKSEYDARPGQVRKDIMYHSQATGDDKSICFIQLHRPAE